MQATIDRLTRAHARIVDVVAQHPAAALWCAIALLALTLAVR